MRYVLFLWFSVPTLNNRNSSAMKMTECSLFLFIYLNVLSHNVYTCCMESDTFCHLDK